MSGEITPVNENRNLPQNQEERPLFRQRALDLIETLSIGLPPQARRLLGRWLEKLADPWLDVVAAKAEGVASNIRSATATREAIAKATAESISTQLRVDPAVASSLGNEYARKFLQRQECLEAVTVEAVKSLKENPPPPNQTEAPQDAAQQEAEEEWFNEFEELASRRTSAEMRTLFGKILAGKIRNSGDFSLRSVNIILQLDTSTAEIFRHFCSMVIAIGGGKEEPPTLAKLATLGTNASHQGLPDHEISYFNLVQLSEAGLIAPDWNSYFTIYVYKKGQSSQNSFVNYAGKPYILMSADEASPAEETVRFNGVSLTKVGCELYSVIEVEPKQDYSAALSSWLEKKNLRMRDVVKRDNQYYARDSFL